MFFSVRAMTIICFQHIRWVLTMAKVEFMDIFSIELLQVCNLCKESTCGEEPMEKDPLLLQFIVER